MKKKMLCLLLSIVMLVGLLPSTVFASSVADEDETLIETSEPKSDITFEFQSEEIITAELPKIETSAQPVMNFALAENGQPALKDTNEVKWIDRIADLPDYAVDFCTWLEENSGVDGALVDPTKAEQYADGYTYKFVVTGSETVDASLQEIGTVGNAILTDVISEKFKEATPYFNVVFQAFDRDHPEVFWLDGASRIGAGGTGTPVRIGYNKYRVDYKISLYFYLTDSKYNYDIRAKDYRDVDTITTAIASRDAAIEEILSGIDSDATTYEKIKYINNWLTKNNCYNSSFNLSAIDHDCHECTSALLGTTGKEGPVCEGYARAFKVLCDELDIPCVLVDGTAITNSGGGAHMWNYVQVGDSWYAVDATWNDPTVSGVTSAVSKHENENYLLVGSETVIDSMKFIESHPVSNTVSSTGVAFINGPELSADAYETDPAIVDGVYQIANDDQLNNFFEAVRTEDDPVEAVLMEDCTINGAAMIPENVTLDINGNMLTVTSRMFASYGSVVDGDVGGNGGLVIGENDMVILQHDNPFMPIYDTENGCYKFFNYEIAARGAKSVDGNKYAAKFGYTLYFDNMDAYTLIANSANAKIGMSVDLGWTGTSNKLNYTVPEETLELFAETAERQMKEKGKVTAAVTLTVKGMQSLADGTVVDTATTVTSTTRVTKSSDISEYTLAL